MIRYLILIIVFSLSQNVESFGQVTDSVSVAPNQDSLILKNTKIKGAYPIPKRALLLSLVPGLGQAYNKKIWKVPIVLGGIGFATYMIQKNKKEYNRLDRAYHYRFDGNPATVDTEFSLYSDDAIYRIRAGYDKNVQVAWIWTGVVYSLNLIDAFVDAHLAHFDVNDDLSLEVLPSTMGGVGLGFVGVFHF